MPSFRVAFTFTKGYIESASTNGHRLAVASIINQNNDFIQDSEINTDEELSLIHI